MSTASKAVTQPSPDPKSAEANLVLLHSAPYTLPGADQSGQLLPNEIMDLICSILEIENDRDTGSLFSLLLLCQAQFDLVAERLYWSVEAKTSGKVEEVTNFLFRERTGLSSRPGGIHRSNIGSLGLESSRLRRHVLGSWPGFRSISSAISIVEGRRMDLLRLLVEGKKVGEQNGDVHADHHEALLRDPNHARSSRRPL